MFWRLLCVAVWALPGGVSAAIADAPPLSDKQMMDLARTMKPGESLTRGDLRVTLHQRDAGSPDAHGWYSARSTEGHFSVRLPGPFTDVSSTAKTTDGVPMKMHLLASTTRLVLLCFDRLDAKYADDVVESMLEALKKRVGQYFQSEPFSHGAVQGSQFQTNNTHGARIAGQIFIAEGQLCQFLAQLDESPSLDIPTKVSESFASFRPRPKVKH